MTTPVSALLERKGARLYSVAPHVTVAEAVAEMNLHRVGAIVVLENDRLAGIFTERDVLRRVVGAGRDPLTTRVSDVMSTEVITVTPETTIEQTMELFTERRCRHFPVITPEGIRGLISIGDVTRWMTDLHRAEAEHLKNYIHGGPAT